jgi:hypothetical protein
MDPRDYKITIIICRLEIYFEVFRSYHTNSATKRLCPVSRWIMIIHSHQLFLVDRLTNQIIFTFFHSIAQFNNRAPNLSNFAKSKIKQLIYNK